MDKAKNSLSLLLELENEVRAPETSFEPVEKIPVLEKRERLAFNRKKPAHACALWAQQLAKEEATMHRWRMKEEPVPRTMFCGKCYHDSEDEGCGCDCHMGE